MQEFQIVVWLNVVGNMFVLQRFIFADALFGQGFDQNFLKRRG